MYKKPFLDKNNIKLFLEEEVFYVEKNFKP